MSTNFDPIASRYDETRGGDERGATYAAALKPHLPSGCPLLEIGVGTGLVAQAMDADVVGVDISEAMLSRAHPRLGSRVARADGVVLPFADNTFGGVYCVWVVHLVADPVALFVEVRRVLRPGSPFVVRPTLMFPPTDDIQAILDPLYLALARRPRPDTEDAITASAAAAGLLVATVDQAPGTIEHAPDEVIESIESRAGALFWDLDDDTWATTVEPALDALRALPDRARKRVRDVVELTIVLTST